MIKLSLLVIAFFISLTPALSQDHGDALVSASIADSRTLNPILASDTASSEVAGLIFNGLVKYDKEINLTPDLAESWEIKEGGLAIIFHLKKNVRWHDGYPFSAADVAFTYQKLIDPKVKTPYSGDFERVRSLEVMDDYTLKVVYKEPFVPALSSWGMSILPKHILEGQDLNTSSFSRNPVGTGPFKFKRWRSQEKIELVANPDYFQHRPNLDRYIFRVISDESTIFLELQAQGVDSAGLSPLQYLRQTDTAFFRRYYRKFKLSSFVYTYLAYNLRDEKFTDKRVRQALNYAVDKEELIKMVFLGLGQPITGPFYPESWAYNHNVKPINFDPDKARQLLKEAGWSDADGDGVLEKNGEKFIFTLITNQGNEERLKSAQIIQLRLKDVGVVMKIKVVEWSVFLSEYINKRKFEAVLLGWSLPREPDNYDIWHSSKTREGEFNFIGYRNDEVDRLLTEGRRVFDQARRKACYNRIHEILYDEQPYMFLYAPDSLFVIHSRFQGIKQEPIGIGYNLIDWWVPKKEQRYSRVTE